MAKFYILVTAELATATREDRSKSEGWESCEADGLNHAILIAEIARFKRFGVASVAVHVWKGNVPKQVFPW